MILTRGGDRHGRDPNCHHLASRPVDTVPSFRAIQMIGVTLAEAERRAILAALDAAHWRVSGNGVPRIDSR